MAPEGGSDGAWLVVHHADGRRQHHRLTLALTTLGRSDQNVIEVLDPKLSRFHCEVERRGQTWTIRDCNSRNGTLVNGEAISATPRPLRDHDRITIGRTELVFLTSAPADLRQDPAMVIVAHQPTAGPQKMVSPGAATAVAPIGGDEDEAEVGGEAPTTIGWRGTQPFDPRQTMRVQQVVPRGDAWRTVALAAIEGFDATSRGALLERAVAEALSLMQARGALLVLLDEKAQDALVVTAAVGLDPEGRERCLELGRRVVVTRDLVLDDRRALGVPVRARGKVQGALVLHDLPAAPAQGAVEVEALTVLAGALARTLGTSLQLEEVRRDERAAHGERLAHDLRQALMPAPEETRAAGIDVGFARAPSSEAGRDLALRMLAPSRAGRQELFLALAETPDPDAPPPPRFRRRGERSFLSLVGQAELCGALRALVAVLPRTDEVLLQLDRALRAGRPPSRAAVALLRYDPASGALRFAGAGHAPLIVRRVSGAVETSLALAPALGAGSEQRHTERELRWEKGDLAVVVTASAVRAASRQGGAPIGEQGLRKLVVALDPALPAAELADRLVGGLLRHHGAPELSDAAAFVLRRVP